MQSDTDQNTADNENGGKTRLHSGDPVWLLQPIIFKVHVLFMNDGNESQTKGARVGQTHF